MSGVLFICTLKVITIQVGEMTIDFSRRRMMKTMLLICYFRQKVIGL